MRMMMFRGFAIALLLACDQRVAAQAPDEASAQDLRAELERLRQELEAVRQQYGDRLAALEAKLTSLEAAAAPPAGAPGVTPPQAEVPPGAAGAGGPTGALPIYGGATAASKLFNPDMAVIGDFLGAAGRNRLNPSDPLEMHESEASLQAVVDPYARADFFLAFGEEGVDLEEGFITFPTLPGGLLAKAGKMRAVFGKVNTLHNHLLPWTDRPLVTENLVGGEEGLSDAGMSAARLISNPWVFLEATGQVYRGRSAGLFEASRTRDLTYVGHLRGYQDLTEGTNLDLGVSYARGHNDAGPGLVTELYGFDATLRYRPLRRSIYRSFVGRSEVVWSRRNQIDARQDAMGYYLSGDYQFARRWFVGARYDRSERRDDASMRDTGGSVVLTFWPSEFSQVRGQYRRLRYAEGETANQVLFQFQFSIGAHGAHAF